MFLKKFTLIRLTIFFLFISIFFRAYSAEIQAAGFYSNIKKFSAGVGYNTNTQTLSNSPFIIISQVIAFFLGILGVIFFLIIFYSGYMWMTANGNSDQVEEAKKKMQEAAIGLFIIFAAYAFTYLIFDKLIVIIQRP